MIEIKKALRILETKKAQPSTDYQSAEVYDLAIKILENTLDKTGTWIDNHNGTFVCNKCGCKHSKSAYCPDCGRYMLKTKQEIYR